MNDFEEVVVWLGTDIRMEYPTICHAPFSITELAAAMKTDWPPERWQELTLQLEQTQVLSPTNKVGPDGTYYMLAQQFYIKVRNNRIDKTFVERLPEPSEGFCILQGKEKLYRMSCEGRKCKFYFATEKRCAKGKLFLE